MDSDDAPHVHHQRLLSHATVERLRHNIAAIPDESQRGQLEGLLCDVVMGAELAQLGTAVAIQLKACVHPELQGQGGGTRGWRQKPDARQKEKGEVSRDKAFSHNKAFKQAVLFTDQVDTDTNAFMTLLCTAECEIDPRLAQEVKKEMSSNLLRAGMVHVLDSRPTNLTYGLQEPDPALGATVPGRQLPAWLANFHAPAGWSQAH